MNARNIEYKPDLKHQVARHLEQLLKWFVFSVLHHIPPLTN